MRKIRITSVEYTNSIPFVYGIEHNKIRSEIELFKDIPSECARKIIYNEVDIALIPVAELLNLPYYEIISDYCIAASGKVRTVVLASDYPLDQIERVYLDHHSRSGAMLSRILAKNYWEIDPDWETGQEGFEKDLKPNTAGVIIGDKVFHIENQYKYVYDLADEWRQFTGLPFVFAAWVANKPIEKSFIDRFNQSLKYGTDQIKNVVERNNFHWLPKHIDVRGYLTDNLDFRLDSDKKKGIDLFLKYITEYKTHHHE